MSAPKYKVTVIYCARVTLTSCPRSHVTWCHVGGQ